MYSSETTISFGGKRMKIRLGTRGSKLALIQANQIKALLETAYPQHDISIHIIQTYGDTNQKTPLHQMQTSGVFVKEIEQQLAKHQIDIAVHSMKDLPAQLAEPFVLCDAIVREDARDVLITKQNVPFLKLPQHAKLATGSLRRKYQLLEKRPDLQIMPIRGNIDTRLNLLKTEDLDGIVVAAAAIHRLQQEPNIVMYFDEWDMIPSPCQGAIGLEIRKEDHELYELIQAVSNPKVQAEIRIERAFLQFMNGGCHVPMGARCHIGEQLHFICMYGKEDGSALVKREVCMEPTSSLDWLEALVTALKEEVA